MLGRSLFQRSPGTGTNNRDRKVQLQEQPQARVQAQAQAHTGDSPPPPKKKKPSTVSQSVLPQARWVGVGVIVRPGPGLKKCLFFCCCFFHSRFIHEARASAARLIRARKGPPFPLTPLLPPASLRLSSAALPAGTPRSSHEKKRLRSWGQAGPGCCAAARERGLRAGDTRPRWTQGVPLSIAYAIVSRTSSDRELTWASVKGTGTRAGAALALAQPAGC